MKKLISLMMVLLLCTALVCPVLAAETTAFVPSASFGEDGPPETPTVPGEDATVPGADSEAGDAGEGAEDAPYTGDNSQQQMMVWGGVMAAALAGIIALVVVMKKRASEAR